MYSGTTLTLLSGRLLGAHQKIDRVSRRQLQNLLPESQFPSIRSILHFEGGNGPDSIKRKSPAKNEPWHFFLPFDETDTQILVQIKDHYNSLVAALKEEEDVRAAFEASWLAHAIVDGLTPAHHYPYEEKLVELMSGRGIETRTSVKHKVVMPGETRKRQISNNWKMWGPKGLFLTHTAFEWGVATIMAPMRLVGKIPTLDELEKLDNMTLEHWYRSVAQEIAHLGIYDSFYKTGWTIPLAMRIRSKLAPNLVKAVTAVWYKAVIEAGKTR
jgi:hypothetical protein